MAYIKYILKAINAVLLIIVCIAFFGSHIIFDSGNTYNEISSYEYPFAGMSNIKLDENYVYCFSQYYQAVNVYRKNGEFVYSLKVPGGQNGDGYIYFQKGYFCIKNNQGDIYQYKNGRYCFRIYRNDKDILEVYDAKNRCRMSNAVDKEPIVYHNGKIETSTSKDELFMRNYEERDVTGDNYSISFIRPQLLKNGQVIRKPSLLKVLCSSPILSTIYFFGWNFLGMIITFIQKKGGIL